MPAAGDGGRTPMLLASQSNGGKSCGFFRSSYLDLKHCTSEVSGFYVDDIAMEIILNLLMDHLKEMEGSVPWDSKCVSREDLALLDCLNLSVNKDGFGSRMLLFSKYLFEAQWRYKIVMSNTNAGRSFLSFSEFQ